MDKKLTDKEKEQMEVIKEVKDTCVKLAHVLAQHEINPGLWFQKFALDMQVALYKSQKNIIDRVTKKK